MASNAFTSRPRASGRTFPSSRTKISICGMRPKFFTREGELQCQQRNVNFWQATATSKESLTKFVPFTTKGRLNCARACVGKESNQKH